MDKSITVIQGYHFGFKNRPEKHPYLDVNKAYNFKITSKTHHPRNLKKYRTCRVLTAKGKANLVITKIMHINGSIALQAAKHLKPVLNCYPSGMELTWLYYLLRKNTSMSLTNAQIKSIVHQARQAYRRRQKRQKRA